MVERAELRQCRLALEARVPRTADQDITLGEQRAAAQAGWRAVGGVEGEVDLAVLGLLFNAWWHQFENCQPRAWRGATQGVERWQHDGRFTVVGGGHAPGVGGVRRLKRAGGRNGLLQRFQCLP